LNPNCLCNIVILYLKKKATDTMQSLTWDVNTPFVWQYNYKFTRSTDKVLEGNHPINIVIQIAFHFIQWFWIRCSIDFQFSTNYIPSSMHIFGSGPSKVYHFNVWSNFFYWFSRRSKCKKFMDNGCQVMGKVHFILWLRQPKLRCT
jgi:hypothetical protein